jgi:hypothetical protein
VAASRNIHKLVYLLCAAAFSPNFLLRDRLETPTFSTLPAILPPPINKVRRMLDDLTEVPVPGLPLTKELVVVGTHMRGGGVLDGERILDLEHGLAGAGGDVVLEFLAEGKALVPRRAEAALENGKVGNAHQARGEGVRVLLAEEEMAAGSGGILGVFGQLSEICDEVGFREVEAGLVWRVVLDR